MILLLLLLLFVATLTIYAFVKYRYIKKEDNLEIAKKKIENNLNTILINMENCKEYERLVSTNKWAYNIVDASFNLSKDTEDNISAFQLSLKHKIDETFNKTKSEIIYSNIN